MRAWSRILSVAAILTIASVQALAQMPFLGPTPKFQVIMTVPEAKKDLKLTKDQDKQINEIIKAATGMSPNAAMGMGGVTGVMSDLDVKAMAVLTAEQQARAKQIWIQYDGPVVLEDKEIADEVKLTDDQKSRVKIIWSDYQAKFLEKARSGPMGLKGLKDVRKTANEATLAVLTPEQLKQFTDMQGKELKMRGKREI